YEITNTPTMLSHVMSSPSAPTVLEPITPTDRARDSPRAAPRPPNYTLAALDYTPDTPHLDEDSDPMEASETRTASASGSTSPLSPDHALTQTLPTSTLSRAFYYHSTTRMAVRTQPTLSRGISARVTEAMAYHHHHFVRSTSEPILDTETEGDESEAKGTGSESEESEGEGPDSEGEEAAYEDQQQQAIPVEDTAADEPLGLGYRAARRRALELAEGPTPSMFEEDPVDDIVYTDIEYVMPPVCAPVQTSTSPKWSSGSLPVSPASLTVPAVDSL
ncbi:hypothetical protein Tco_1169078, partial [Tanacetum coccineum]